MINMVSINLLMRYFVIVYTRASVTRSKRTLALCNCAISRCSVQAWLVNNYSLTLSFIVSKPPALRAGIR